VSGALQGHELDFLFVDGDHSYEGVWQDFRDYAPLVREGGLIAFHDIMPDFKTRYGIDTPAWTGGVYRFWAEIREQWSAISIVDKEDQDGFGIGVIRYSHFPTTTHGKGRSGAGRVRCQR
jgi:predicted O-methyltransferase YrrM